MNKIFFYLTLSLLSFNTINAQTQLRSIVGEQGFESFADGLSNAQRKRNNNPDLYVIDDNNNIVFNFKGVKGSPYENNTFSLGIVTNESNNKKVNMYLRYNIYGDEIEIRSLKNAFNINETKRLLKEKDISCSINGKTYHYISFINEFGTENYAYLILLYKGPHSSLYKRLSSKFTPKQEAENSFTQPSPPTFDTRTTYYIKKGETISFLPNKKKYLLKQYDNKDKILKSFISKYRINLKKEAGLISLVKFLGSSI